MNPGGLVISCEHASSFVPAKYRRLFAREPAGFALHRVYDIGVAPIARGVAEALEASYMEGGITRMLIDLNRHHPKKMFSAVSRALPEDEREALRADWHGPYYRRLSEMLEQARTAKGEVLHVSFHSFTPVWKAKIRNADIGLLYDPARASERACCEFLRARLRQMHPEVRIRLNYPYYGNTDGATTFFRQRVGAGYLGVEVEINQRDIGKKAVAGKWRDALCDALRAWLSSLRSG
ncbi:MAG: N-formylglutamate amidohydrolase [Spartobacteria bacterium]|nr:N-formylglutamate amidohydrolase [Spartobacteria bacterium]